MTWYNATVLAISVTIALGGLFILPFVLVSLFDKLLNSYRRNKHPDYFKYWDAALAKSFERGAEFKARKERFDYYMKRYNDGLRDGECTIEYYTKQMNKHMVEYQELCTWFQKEEKEIKELLIKADLYAKEHDLYWGIIYDTKSK